MNMLSLRSQLAGSLLWCAMFALPAAAVAQPLQAELRQAVSAARLGPVEISVCVIDVESGQVLASMNEKQTMVPASNLKILTSGAALITLGAEFKFSTKFSISGTQLIVTGDGDPGLADPKLLAAAGMTLDEFFLRLTKEIGARGGQGITEVIIDDRVFDSEFVHPSWPKNQLDAWYAAPVTGLNFYTNCVEFFIAPASRTGGAPSVRTIPAGAHVEVRNSARTVGGDSTDLSVARGDKAGFTVSGSVASKLRQAEPIEVTMRDPSMMFGQILAEKLTAAGLAVAAPTVRRVNSGETLPKGTVAAIVTTPIDAVLSRCNVNSQNLYAEALLKRMGHAVSGQPGSWQNGSAVVRMLVAERLGSEVGELALADGSGLSRDNKLTTSLLCNWLVAMAKDKRHAGPFLASMADLKSERVADRFKNRKLAGNVHAKTGFISGVQSLSGYVTSANGQRRAAYSVIINNTNKAAAGAKVKEFHEDVVQAVDRYLAK